MKILILNTSEKVGGAAVAANRLMKALNISGVYTKTLVCDKQTDDSDVIPISTSFLKEKVNNIKFYWERLIIFLAAGFSKKNLFRVSIANTGTDISKHPLIQDADIIHLHWINQGFLSLNDIKKLTKLNKPIVWTMHDMWPCTGICHHARECESYQGKCGNCFYLNSEKKKDLSNRIFNRKKTLYENTNISFVCCSNWLTNRVKKSSLTKDKTILTIPNPIDCSLFKKANPEDSRIKLNLPADKRLILFGALNVTDKQKGIDYLIESFNHIRNNFPNDYENLGLVVFGKVKEEIANSFNIPIYSLGYLNRIEDIILLYSAVDLFVTSSLDENLPNTIMEAMACGTPCVGFNTGGIPEMIDHKQNGYIAEYKNAMDLAKGIKWVLNEADYSKLSNNAREKVINNYSEDIVARQYIELYNRLFNIQ